MLRHLESLPSEFVTISVSFPSTIPYPSAHPVLLSVDKKNNQGIRVSLSLLANGLVIGSFLWPCDLPAVPGHTLSEAYF